MEKLISLFNSFIRVLRKYIQEEFFGIRHEPYPGYEMKCCQNCGEADLIAYQESWCFRCRRTPQDDGENIIYIKDLTIYFNEDGK